jgi:16S rRNA (guanine966-N2)-methyltransferase
MQIISGIFRSRKILAPKGQETRPTSSRLREALFNICQGGIEGVDFLDLFAGSGAMGFEALSRGARSAMFVDGSRESIRCIKSNTSMLDVEGQVRVVYSDVFDALKRLSGEGAAFDIIYADPPYSTLFKGHGEEIPYSSKVLSMIDEIAATGHSLLKPGGALFIEEAVKTASEQEKQYRHLRLSSARTMGKSTLYHWVEGDNEPDQIGDGE